MITFERFLDFHSLPAYRYFLDGKYIGEIGQVVGVNNRPLGYAFKTREMKNYSKLYLSLNLAAAAMGKKLGFQK